MNLKLKRWPQSISSIKDYLDASKSSVDFIKMSGVNTPKGKGRPDLPQLPTLESLSPKEMKSIKDYVKQVESYTALVRRREALFFLGYALLQIGDARGAKKRWDLLYKEAPKDIYGLLAEKELHMLGWREQIAPKVLKKITQ